MVIEGRADPVVEAVAVQSGDVAPCHNSAKDFFVCACDKSFNLCLSSPAIKWE